MTMNTSIRTPRRLVRRAALALAVAAVAVPTAQAASTPGHAPDARGSSTSQADTFDLRVSTELPLGSTVTRNAPAVTPAAGGGYLKAGNIRSEALNRLYGGETHSDAFSRYVRNNAPSDTGGGTQSDAFSRYVGNNAPAPAVPDAAVRAPDGRATAEIPRVTIPEGLSGRQFGPALFEPVSPIGTVAPSPTQVVESDGFSWGNAVVGGVVGGLIGIMLAVALLLGMRRRDHLAHA